MHARARLSCAGIRGFLFRRAAAGLVNFRGIKGLEQPRVYSSTREEMGLCLGIVVFGYWRERVYWRLMWKSGSYWESSVDDLK